MANDNVVTGRKYRILSNATTRLWDVISFWTKAQDVELNDGTTVQDKLDAVDQTTTELTTTVSTLSGDTGATVTGAPNYDPTKKYAKGDIVSYNGTFYYCKTAINTPEAWNPAHWMAISEAIPFRFGIDSYGKYGYYKAGADSVTPFSSKMKFITLANNDQQYTFNQHFSQVMIVYYYLRYYSWIGDDDNNRFKGTLSMSLGDKVITGSSDYLIEGQLIDTAYDDDRKVILYAVCTVDNVNQSDVLTINRSVVLDGGSGSGTVAYGEGGQKVIIGIE